MGFGKVQSVNLVTELKRSMTEPVENWRWLAAWGIHALGRGDSRKLLAVHDINTLNKLTAADMLKISGFGKTKATSVVNGLELLWSQIKQMLPQFNLLQDEVVVESRITGKRIVFTGSMPVNRSNIKKQAVKLGAIVQANVSSRTDMLVTGAGVSKLKIKKAKRIGVNVLDYDTYNELINI